MPALAHRTTLRAAPATLAAATLLRSLTACAPAPTTALDLRASAPTTTPSASPSAIATARATAPPEPSPGPPSRTASTSNVTRLPEGATFSAEQLDSLSDLLREGRAFRHVLLGQMPSERVRDTWMRSRDGQRLTLACEQADHGGNERGSPHPRRWYVVASATFVAVAAEQGQWPTRYRREQLVEIAGAPRTACAGLRDGLEMTCRHTTVQVYGPDAFVPVETRNEDPIRWRPSTRRAMDGVGCQPAGGDPDGFVLGFYDFAMSDPKPPMIFFGDAGRVVERVVFADAAQYNDFREATLGPFDGALPPHLRSPAP